MDDEEVPVDDQFDQPSSSSDDDDDEDADGEKVTRRIFRFVEFRRVSSFSVGHREEIEEDPRKTTSSERTSGTRTVDEYSTAGESSISQRARSDERWSDGQNIFSS